jgi:hypothetical protein
MRMCIGLSMCLNTQMVTFCTYALDLHSFKLLMNDLPAFEYQPIKTKSMCIVYFNTPRKKCVFQEPLH